MSRQIQLRRGTSTEHETFTGAPGEVTVDTTANTLRVHDGQTPGGTELARAESVTDMTGTDYVVAWQMPTAENNYTWYRKYKSGWLEQGGKLSGRSVVFPCAFSQVPTVCTSTIETNTGVVANSVINSVTKTGFAGYKTQGNSDWDSGSLNMSGYWTAFGIAAE